MPARQCLLGHIVTRAGQDERHVVGQPVAGVLEQEPDHPLDRGAQVGHGQRGG
jgi:hypothetical protein